jgi:membrane-bound serine protease (ClpP class)
MILNDNIVAKSGYASVPDLSHLIGIEGTAFTDLRPSGTALLNGQRIDVVSEGNYIVRNSNVYVKSIEGSKVVVDLKK